MVLGFCALVVYLTLFYKLGNLAFIGADEPRYARIAEEMNVRNEYVTPTINFGPWLEKPPLLFWLEAASFKLFGVHESAARLPVALLGAGTVFLCALLAFHLAGWRAAILSALILTTSGLFFVFARAASTDMPFTAMLSAGLVSGFLATVNPAILLAAASGASLALAVLAKGPVALVLFGGIFLFYFLIVQEFRWTLVQSFVGLVAFLVLGVPWFWKVWRENGYDFIATFWLNHHLARFITDIHHHSKPFWYYLPVLVIGFFPWIFFLAPAVKRLWLRRSSLNRPQDQPSLLLWLWIVIPLAFFSLSESKLPGYILPVLPPLAVVLGLEWDRYLDGDLTAHRLMKTQLATFSVFGLGMVVALIVGFHWVYQSLETGVLLSAPIFMAAVWVGLEFKQRRPLPLFLVLIAAMTLFASLAFWKAAPVVDDFHSSRDLSRISLRWISSQQPLILYRYFHHTAHYYTDYRATEEPITALDALKLYMSSHPQSSYCLLTQEAGWKDLQAAFRPHLIRHQGNLYLVRITL